MAIGIDRLWLGRSRSRQPRLRWALPHEPHWDQRQDVDEMWREIAIGKRPCLCAVSLDGGRRGRQGREGRQGRQGRPAEPGNAMGPDGD